MGTVLSNFHGQKRTKTRRATCSDKFFKVRMIEPIDSRSRIRNAKGKDIGQPFAHSRVVPFEPERRVVSRCIVTWLFYFLPACRTSRFATIPGQRARIARMPVRVKIENRLAALNCFVFSVVFEFLAFLQFRNCLLLIHSGIVRFLSTVLAVERYTAFKDFLDTNELVLRTSLFPFLFFDLLRCFRTCRRRTGKRREEVISER